MAAPFKILINNPCNEKWLSMQGDQSGRFCSSCQKSVTDFTRFSDSDLKLWFAKNENTGCGRFNPDQINRLINTKSSLSLLRLKPGLIAASLLAFLSFPKLANAVNKSHHTYQTDAKKFRVDKKVLPSEKKLITIKGRVIDSDENLPLAGGSVRVKGTTIATVADKEGNFELKVDKNDFKNNLVLEFTAVGFESRSFKVNLKKTETITVTLRMKYAILGGFGVIKTPNLLHRITSMLNC
ncbi:MAG: carboxypeptidase-like regulatory domain-containing protein [Pedobacter sp.]|nr:MAG: carboxypeptidase-like regulatory domain-containing protein [Pedobacter sp.]